jgi:hypothetical protein
MIEPGGIWVWNCNPCSPVCHRERLQAVLAGCMALAMPGRKAMSFETEAAAIAAG